MRRSSALDRCYSIDDLRDLARSRLPDPIFQFLDGGAETEATLVRNTAAFDEFKLISRCLVDVRSIQTSTRILGQDVEWPLFCSPTGASRLFHADGELAVARAAASTGTLYGVATGATYSLEDIAQASKGPKMFLLSPHRNRDLMWELIERCKRARYPALCLMIDVPMIGKRERDLRTGFSSWSNWWSMRRILSIAAHPTWAVRQLRRGPVRLANLRHGAGELDPSITWSDVREIADRWQGPFALKGVMSADDACRAADMGVSAIIVSNHGGRQLDGAAAPIDVLPEIARAVGDRVEIILDGGIRRGVHILKALACGAKACSIGRAYLYGLSAGGEAGVLKALQILRSELTLSMKLAGCPDVKSVNPTLVRRSFTLNFECSYVTRGT